MTKIELVEIVQTFAAAHAPGTEGFKRQTRTLLAKRKDLLEAHADFVTAPTEAAKREASRRISALAVPALKR